MKMTFNANESHFHEKGFALWPHFKSEVSSVEHGNDLLVYKTNRCLNCDADEFLEWVKAVCL